MPMPMSMPKFPNGRYFKKEIGFYVKNFKYLLKIFYREKVTYSKLRFQDIFLVAPTQADITEFSNFLFQLKNRRSGSKTVYGFTIILISRGIMTFWSQRGYPFLLNRKKRNRIENERSHAGLER